MHLRNTLIAGALATVCTSCVEDDEGEGDEHDAEFADVVVHDLGAEIMPRAKTQADRATSTPRYPPRFEQNAPDPAPAPSAQEPSRVRSTNSKETSSPSTAVMLEPHRHSRWRRRRADRATR
jgi:hypothetical protein